MQTVRLVLWVLASTFLFTACPPAPPSGLGSSTPEEMGKENYQNTSSQTPTVPIEPAAPAAPATPAAPAAPATPAAEVPARKEVRNIILMIGDGMGVSQITAAMYSNGNKLQLERFPVIGLHKSYASDNLVTDSAAGATAFSAGVKTYNGAIGVGPDTQAVRTILEAAEANNMATGLVSTCSVTHATPASFVAHNEYRKNMEAIALDFMKVEVDLLIGGGQKYFDRRTEDERNLLEELRHKGYAVSSFLNRELKDLQFDVRKNIAHFTAAGEPLPVLQGRDYLLAAIQKSLAFLNEKAGKRGFFLMIEGAQIDWGGHANNSEYIISETIEFDKAIGQVLDFAAADGHTLVIVTADHETGGYAINYGSKMDSIVPAFTSDYHTAALIPVFAYGPGAEEFAGIYENTAIFHKMMRLLGL